MPVNLSGPRQAPTKTDSLGISASFPQAGFFAVVLLAFGLWIATRAALPDLAMPLVATLFLGFAAAFGGGGPAPCSPITRWRR